MNSEHCFSFDHSDESETLNKCRSYVNVQTVLSVVSLFIYKQQCDEGFIELRYCDSFPGIVLLFFFTIFWETCHYPVLMRERDMKCCCSLLEEKDILLCADYCIPFQNVTKFSITNKIHNVVLMNKFIQHLS